MATGTWEDFTDKYGFSDGEGVEQRDFEARARLVEMLNHHEAMKAAGLHALEYDRPGLQSMEPSRLHRFMMVEHFDQS